MNTTDMLIMIMREENAESISPASKPFEGVELIQQWQAYGKVHPKLLEDKTFEYCKKARLTSLQSYVYWAEIEKELNIIDFSTYDVLVEKIRRHDLKWVPFFILGPYYATPLWFQESEESVYAKCLEHRKETNIQSIWNPYLPKHVDGFLRVLGEHYKGCDVLESITLGISGNWGEAIYPATGGFHQSKNLHTHPGWWCGDEYAITDFKESMKMEYGPIEELNNSWNTSFKAFDEITYPQIKSSGFIGKYFSLLPDKEFLMSVLMNLSSSRNLKETISEGIQKAKEKGIFPFKEKKKSPKVKWWLDFVCWYLDSMTNWADYWIKTARKYFPDTEIYLVTGGDGNPVLGADFSAQVKIAAKYNAGIRITNQNDDYAQSFILTRLVASASRFYNTYFTTEEGLYNSPEGVTMRIFDVATSGAKGAYFKTIIREDTYHIFMGGNEHGIGEPTEGAINLAQNIHHLTLEKPIVDVAVLFPNTSIALDPAALSSVYKQSSKLRDMLDFDFVDEKMVADGALRKYQFLILLDGDFVREKTLMEIERWINDGGILIANQYGRLSTIGGDKDYQQLFNHGEGIEEIGNGYEILYSGKRRDYLRFIKQAVYNQEKIYPWLSVPEIDEEEDGVYAARLAHKILYYNSTGHAVKKSVKINNLPEKRSFVVEIKPYSIVSVSILEWKEGICHKFASPKF